MDIRKICTITREKILSIMETLQWFCIILMGKNIIIYTGHNSFTHKSTYTDCFFVLYQILFIEYYCAELFYIKLKNNLVADTLLRLYSDHIDVVQKYFINHQVRKYPPSKYNMPTFLLGFRSFSESQEKYYDFSCMKKS